jgi:hypothetical protein
MAPSLPHAARGPRPADSARGGAAWARAARLLDAGARPHYLMPTRGRRARQGACGPRPRAECPRPADSATSRGAWTRFKHGSAPASCAGWCRAVMDVAAVHVPLRRCMDAGAWTRPVYRPAYMDTGRPMDHRRNQDVGPTSRPRPTRTVPAGRAGTSRWGRCCGPSPPHSHSAGAMLRLRPHALPHRARLRAVSGGGVTLTLGGRTRMLRIRWCAV